MNTSKIIKGVVGGGRYTVTAPIIKEDYGLYLQIEGIELPDTYEVDFSNDEHSGTSVTMIGNADGVLIPSQFISSGKDVFAFLYHVGADFGRTVYKFRIPNKLRPDRTDEQPTPEEQSVIDQAISALNSAVEQTAQDKADADVSAQNASADAERAEEARTDAQNYATQAEQATDDAQTYANNASASATASAQSAQSASQSAQTASEKVDSITGLTATAQTLPSGSSATASYSNGTLTLGIPRGADGRDGTDGTDGNDGYSPTANVSKTGKTATITITDKTGTTSAQVEDGTDGTDGVSPTVTITPITGGHRITITDADGEHSADVMDGTGNVDDVQINGTSIVTDGVANIPLASSNNFGAVKSYPYYGIDINNHGIIYVNNASESDLKAGTNDKKPLTSNREHIATFYGLAKAAGDATQSRSSNAVGVYTDDAKIAIQKMLGIYEAPWELIREDTFTNAEEADHIIDVDANGEAFELIDALVIFALPKQNSYAKKGEYGQVSYFHDSTEILRTEHGAWEQQANADPRGFISAIENHNGMIFARQSKQDLSGYTVSETIRFPQNLILGRQSSFAFTGNVTINNINIRAVTGTGRYKLYGRRKWQ